MILETLVVGPIQTNCYVVGEEKTREGLIVDPGGDPGRILAQVDKHRLLIKYVVNTHTHFDHMLDNNRTLKGLLGRQETKPELAVHPDAVPLLEQDGGAGWFGVASVPSPRPDRLIHDGDKLSLGSLSFQVLHTPGHAPGSICLYCASEKAVFAGDVLFRRGVGRTDLPGGDWDMLMESIQSRLFILPNETTVYPGHGAKTTIGEEKRNNPFI